MSYGSTMRFSAPILVALMVLAACGQSPQQAARDEPAPAEPEPVVSAVDPVTACTVGGVPPQTTFAALAQRLRQIPLQKDEFETTEAFDARVAQATAALPVAVVLAAPNGSEQITYDADRELFEVGPYYFSMPYSIGSALGYSWDEDSIVGSQNLALTVNTEETPDGTYVGENAFGATRVVERVRRVEQIVFDRKADRYGETLFAAGYREGGPPPVMMIPAPPDRARTLQGQFRAAALIVPRAPFFATGHGRTTPTIQSLRDVSEETQVIVADIRCVMITDANGVVLASRETR